MNLKLEIELSKAEILKEVDTLKTQIDDMRPLPADVEGRVIQKLRLDWNYHSNAIEGNRLNYGETVAFLMEGITAKGKPLKDHLDIRGHNDAINFLLDIVRDTRPLSETDIRALHKMILVEPYTVSAQTPGGLPTTKRVALGEYKTQPNHVQTATGETHYYATPEDTPARIQELMEWYSAASADQTIHPIVIAALFHHRFVAIHPFDDGNGRLSRILMNLILMQNGYSPVIIKMQDRQNYYSLLSRADKGDTWPFVDYIANLLKSSLQLYLNAATGGNIDEDEDIDKEIALLKLRMEAEADVNSRRSNVQIANVLVLQINSLFESLDIKFKKFKDLFFSYDSSIRINSSKYYKYESINQFINTTTLEKKDELFESLKSIDLIFSFKSFKNSTNDFNVEIFTVIGFEDYEYYVSSYNFEKIISKKYGILLYPKEQQKIIKTAIKDFENEFEYKLNLKSPKS